VLTLRADGTYDLTISFVGEQIGAPVTVSGDYAVDSAEHRLTLYEKVKRHGGKDGEVLTNAPLRDVTWRFVDGQASLSLFKPDAPESEGPEVEYKRIHSE
jgi:hypothetical protein